MLRETSGLLSRTLHGVGANALLYMTGRAAQIETLRYLRNQQYSSYNDTSHNHAVLLSDTLNFCREKVPYYCEQLVLAGFNDSITEANALEVLGLFKPLDRATLRKRFDDIKASDNADRTWFENASSGSTGEPVRVLQDRDFQLMSAATKSLFDEWSAYRQGEPKVVLWGSPHELILGREPLRQRAGRWIRNEHWLNVFRMTADDMRGFVNVINNVMPVQMLAYADAAYELARFIDREGLFIYSPKAVMTSAGTLTGGMRETIARVFRTHVFNRYGTREVGDIACMCECGIGLHVNPYTHHVEVLRQDGTPCERGEPGEIVVTCLSNKAMPLLRYKIGDTGVMATGGCNCGRAWPLLSEVSGRMVDIFRRADGTLVSPEYFLHTIGVHFRDNLPSIELFQVIQEDTDLVKIRVKRQQHQESDNVFNVGENKVLAAIVAAVMGESCRLEIECVKEIARDASGKFRYVINNTVRE